MGFQKIELPHLLIRFLTNIYNYNKFYYMKDAFWNKISNKNINKKA